MTDKIQGLYLEAHKKVRANPDRQPAAKDHYKRLKNTIQDLITRERCALLNARLQAAGLKPLASTRCSS
jgi:hypothetical protein